MPSITASDIGDIVTFYLEDYSEKKTWSDAVRDYQHFITADELFTKRRVDAPASEKCTWNLKVDRAQNTTADSFFKPDSLNRVDLGTKGELKWHFQKTHFMVEKREPAMRSKSRTQILDYLKMQESDMYDGFFEQNEDWFFTLPTYPNDGTAGDPLPFGLPYWITKYTSTAPFGFNGAYPTGYTAGKGGVSDTTYSKWKNGTGLYASMSDSDFVALLSQCFDKCHFRAPRGGFGENVPARNYQLMSSYKPWQDYQHHIYGSNDDTGMDAGKWRGGKPGDNFGYNIFRGIQWEWVPALTEVGGDARDLREPVYGINWDTFSLKTYDNLFMDRSDPIDLDGQHNTVVQWMDTAYQIVCNSLRQNFVIAAATASST
jgi:hypothetical protein